MSSRARFALLAAVPVAYLAFFFLYPLGRILGTSLFSHGPGASAFIEVFRDPTIRSVAWFTLWQALLSTILTLLLGVPAAYVFARYRFPGRSLLRTMTLVPFVLPTLVVGVAFLALIGPGSPIGLDLRGTIWAILFAHVFYNSAIVIRGVGVFWERIDPRIEEAARTLGAGRLRVFREVTLPLLQPAILSSAALVFLFTFTSFGVILVLGDLRHTTLEVEIWRLSTAYLRLDLASALAVLQLVGVGAIWFFHGRLSRREDAELPLRSLVSARRRPSSASERILVGGVLAAILVVVGSPLALLVARSLATPHGPGLDHYARLLHSPLTSPLFVSPARAVANSVGFAIPAVVVASTVGLLSAVAVVRGPGRSGRAFDAFLMLPLGTSAVTIGFGFLVAFGHPINLRSTLFIIPIAHSLVAIPFVVRSAVPVMEAVRHRLREAAFVLGASPLRAWWEVDLPLVGRALAVGALFAFAISVGEFGATSFIVRPSTTTIPIAIFRLLGRPGSFGEATALAVVLMAITALAALGIEMLRGEESEGV